jgi:hypothetical protein
MSPQIKRISKRVKKEEIAEDPFVQPRTLGQNSLFSCEIPAAPLWEQLN